MIIYVYRYYCIEEQSFFKVYKDTEEPPGLCINNSSHSINHDSISLLDIIDDSVKIKEYEGNLSGNFKIKSGRITTSSIGLISQDIVFPYDISVISVDIFSNKVNQNDELNVIISPHTLAGVITENLNTGENTLRVSSTVMQNISKGFDVMIGNESLGECFEIIESQNQIKVEETLQNPYLVGEPVKIEYKMFENFVFPDIDFHVSLGNDKIGGSSITKNTITRIFYDSKSEGVKNLSYNINFFV